MHQLLLSTHIINLLNTSNTQQSMSSYRAHALCAIHSSNQLAPFAIVPFWFGRGGGIEAWLKVNSKNKPILTLASTCPVLRFYNCHSPFHCGECPRIKLKLNGRQFANLRQLTNKMSLLQARIHWRPWISFALFTIASQLCSFASLWPVDSTRSPRLTIPLWDNYPLEPYILPSTPHDSTLS